MDVKSFATELARSLTRRGISKELAVKHAVSLVRTFDEDDLREITAYTSSEDFADLSDSLADLIKEKEERPASPAPQGAAMAAEEPERASIATGEIPIPKISDAGVRLADTQTIPTVHTRAFPAVKPSETSPSYEDMKTKEVGIVREEAQDSAKTQVFSAVSAPADEVADSSKTQIFSAVGAEKEEESADSAKTQVFASVAPEEESAEKTRAFKAVKTDSAPVGDWTEMDDGGEGAVVDIIYEESSDQEIYLDREESDESDKVALTKRGRAFFWTIAVGTSPISITAAVLVLAIFALGILTVCALIAACLILVCAEAVAGSGLTLVGLIYGAIQIIEGNTATGLFEIGLGVAAGGAALALGILTYNFAVRVLPYAMKQLITFEGYSLRRVGPMINRFREECNRL